LIRAVFRWSNVPARVAARLATSQFGKATRHALNAAIDPSTAALTFASAASAGATVEVDVDDEIAVVVATVVAVVGRVDVVNAGVVNAGEPLVSGLALEPEEQAARIKPASAIAVASRTRTPTGQRSLAISVLQVACDPHSADSPERTVRAN
jgi:hypothetical protein